VFLPRFGCCTICVTAAKHLNQGISLLWRSVCLRVRHAVKHLNQEISVPLHQHELLAIYSQREQPIFRGKSRTPTAMFGIAGTLAASPALRLINHRTESGLPSRIYRHRANRSFTCTILGKSIFRVERRSKTRRPKRPSAIGHRALEEIAGRYRPGAV
jgi:hypothetical protein